YGFLEKELSAGGAIGPIWEVRAWGYWQTGEPGIRRAKWSVELKRIERQGVGRNGLGIFSGRIVRMENPWWSREWIERAMKSAARGVGINFFEKQAKSLGSN